MSEVKHQALGPYLSETGKKNLPGAIFIFGDEMLCKQALAKVLDVVAPDRGSSVGYEPLDGALAEMGEVIERVNTYALLGDGKSVALTDSRIFHAKADAGKLLEKAKTAFDRDDTKKSAGILLSLLALHQLGLEDLDSPAGRKKLAGAQGSGGETDMDWISDVADYCRIRNLAVPAGGTEADRLAQAVEKGFPRGNFLIITSDVADKRRKLYGILKEHGLVVDCSVPKGDRRSDRDAQSALLRQQAQQVLGGSGKTLAPGAFENVVELTGFDLRTFSGNVEKLVAYVGDRREITAADVGAVLRRTRKDPIYELTNAVSDRKGLPSLAYLDSLLSEGFHPLQVLAALTNQMRKLMVAKGFAQSQAGRVWQPGTPYQRFTAQVMPAVADFDAGLLALLGRWEAGLAPSRGKKSPGKKKAAKSKTDLLVAKNPKSPYPVYLTLKKSDGFSFQRLVGIMEDLAKCDSRLKTTGQDPRIALERVILGICRGEGPAQG